MSVAKRALVKRAAVKKPRQAQKASHDPWLLRLYIAGQTPNSLAAISNLKRICDERLNGQYRVEIVDLLVKPQLAKGDQIVAIPTLVRRLPAPVKKIIGNLSKIDRALIGLDLQKAP